MSRIQTEFLPCPFCDKGQIECRYIPASYTVKHVRSGKGSANIPRKSSEIWLIKTGCNICGKTAKEVEKELEKKNLI